MGLCVKDLWRIETNYQSTEAVSRLKIFQESLDYKALNVFDSTCNIMSRECAVVQTGSFQMTVSLLPEALPM